MRIYREPKCQGAVTGKAVNNRAGVLRMARDIKNRKAPRTTLGAGGRRFESSRPDQMAPAITTLERSPEPLSAWCSMEHRPWSSPLRAR